MSQRRRHVTWNTRGAHHDFRHNSEGKDIDLFSISNECLFLRAVTQDTRLSPRPDKTAADSPRTMGPSYKKSDCEKPDIARPLLVVGVGEEAQPASLPTQGMSRQSESRRNDRLFVVWNFRNAGNAGSVTTTRRVVGIIEFYFVNIGFVRSPRLSR